MVITHPISSDPKTRLATQVTVERLSTTSSSDFALDTEVSFFSSVSEHVIESPSDTSTVLNRDAFLDDEDEELAKSIPSKAPAHVNARVALLILKRATSSEDAFQSYLHDIRGFGLLTHEEEIDLARRSAAAIH